MTVHHQMGQSRPSEPSAEPVAGFRHVLVCLDRSEASERTLALAGHLARVEGARLTLLHVLPAVEPEGGEAAIDTISWEIARQEARFYLEGTARRLSPEVSPEIHVGEGVVAQEVEALAELLGADLIVLSTHGAGGEGAWCLGGTAEKIVALARRALLIVPSHGRAPKPRVPPRRIFVPLDGSLRGECVLPVAMRLARGHDAELVLAHVTSDPVRTEVLATDEDLALARELADRLASRADAYLEQVRARMVAAGVAARTATARSTDHRAGLLALAASERADLFIVAAHGTAASAHRRYGSLTSHLIANAQAPVLVIQDLPAGTQIDTAPGSRLPPRALDGLDAS